MPLTSYLQFAAALVFVLALIGVAAFAARRLGLAQGGRTEAGRRRLTVLESLPLDGKRRLVLIGRDDMTHLLLLGPASETVVEQGIVRSAAAFAAVVADGVSLPSEAGR